MKPRLALAALTACLLLLPLGSALAGARSTSAAGSGRYIVVLEDSAAASRVARSHAAAYGFSLRHVYSHAIKATRRPCPTRSPPH